jgi:hypothetical protein
MTLEPINSLRRLPPTGLTNIKRGKLGGRRLLRPSPTKGRLKWERRDIVPQPDLRTSEEVLGSGGANPVAQNSEGCCGSGVSSQHGERKPVGQGLPLSKRGQSKSRNQLWPQVAPPSHRLHSELDGASPTHKAMRTAWVGHRHSLPTFGLQSCHETGLAEVSVRTLGRLEGEG